MHEVCFSTGRYGSCKCLKRRKVANLSIISPDFSEKESYDMGFYFLQAEEQLYFSLKRPKHRNVRGKDRRTKGEIKRNFAYWFEIRSLN